MKRCEREPTVHKTKLKDRKIFCLTLVIISSLTEDERRKKRSLKKGNSKNGSFKKKEK
jgi:hypothetical protein